MNQQELDALLVEVDMPRAADASYHPHTGHDDTPACGLIKLSVMFADPSDPVKIAETLGKVVTLPNDIRDPREMGHFKRVLTSLGEAARTIVREHAQKGLVPYYSIASNQVTA